MSKNNHLPRAVREQGDKAREAQEAVKASRTGTPPPATPTPPKAGEAPNSGTPQPPALPAAPAPAAPAPDKPTYEQLEEWHRVLKGKYDAEVPRLLQQLRDAKAVNDTQAQTIKARDAEIERLKGEVEKAKKTPPAATAGGEEDDLLPGFSPELGKGVVAAAEKVAATKMAPLLEQIDALKAQLASVGVKADETGAQAGDAAEVAFYRELDRACPDWEALDKLPAFVAWVRTTVEPMSGKTYAVLLNEAVEAGDARRASRFFTDYLAKNPNALKGETVPTSPPVIPPTGNGGGGQPNKGEKRTWTRAEIQAAYVARRQGRYTDDEWNALEADFMAANKEGRLR